MPRKICYLFSITPRKIWQNNQEKWLAPLKNTWPASSVRNGKGYLFYGESGAGKSTLAAHDSRGAVASDDLSLVLPGTSGALELIGSPFRGTFTGGDPVRGRHPLAAGFRLIAPIGVRARSAS